MLKAGPVPFRSVNSGLWRRPARRTKGLADLINRPAPRRHKRFIANSGEVWRYMARPPARRASVMRDKTIEVGIGAAACAEQRRLDFHDAARVKKRLISANSSARCRRAPSSRWGATRPRLAYVTLTLGRETYSRCAYPPSAHRRSR